MAAIAWAAPGLAQTPPEEQERMEAARAVLITQAEGASDRGDHAEALNLAERALAIRSTPSLRLLIATEHNTLGHLIEAFESASRCTREAQADPNTRNRAQVIDACNALTRSLESRLGRVTVDVSTPVPGLLVEVAGGRLSQALWGVPYTVAPGAVVVEARAAGHRPFRQEVTVAAGQSVPVRIALEVDPASAAPSPLPATGAPASQTVSSPATPPRTSPSLVGPIAVGAAGVVSFALAGVFFAMRESTVGERDGQCSPAGCLPTSLDLDATARTQNTMVNVFLGLGAAAAVGAGVWFVAARSGSRAAHSVPLHGALVPLPGGAALGLGGAL